jgi:hypothetical protein
MFLFKTICRNIYQAKPSVSFVDLIFNTIWQIGDICKYDKGKYKKPYFQKNDRITTVQGKINHCLGCKIF